MDVQRVYLSRFFCLDVETNLRRMAEECARAAGLGADICVFPESFLNGYTRRLDPAIAREKFSDLSRSYNGTTFVFGSISEDGFNRMTVWRNGRELSHYDKIHLFDPNNERDLWRPGDRYVAVKADTWTLGLINCNDLRFPEQARALRLKGGADLLVCVAWWPWRRTHVFETLLRARAIENGCFAIGCCIAGSDYPGEIFHGAGNYAFDPMGEPIRTQDDVTYALDRALLGQLMVDPVKDFVDVTRVEVR
jgi:omega-amidase